MQDLFRADEAAEGEHAAQAAWHQEPDAAASTGRDTTAGHGSTLHSPHHASSEATAAAAAAGPVQAAGSSGSSPAVLRTLIKAAFPSKELESKMGSVVATVLAGAATGPMGAHSLAAAELYTAVAAHPRLRKTEVAARQVRAVIWAFPCFERLCMGQYDVEVLVRLNVERLRQMADGGQGLAAASDRRTGATGGTHGRGGVALLPPPQGSSATGGTRPTTAITLASAAGAASAATGATAHPSAGEVRGWAWQVYGRSASASANVLKHLLAKHMAQVQVGPLGPFSLPVNTATKVLATADKQLYMAIPGRPRLASLLAGDPIWKIREREDDAYVKLVVSKLQRAALAAGSAAAAAGGAGTTMGQAGHGRAPAVTAAGAPARSSGIPTACEVEVGE